MDRSRRAMIVTLAAGGLMAAASPVLAAESDAAGMAGEEGWSGVELSAVGGAWRIVLLDPLGPAARAGLRQGDLVIGWSGGSLNSLPPSLSGPAGARFDLIADRAGAPRPVCVILEQRDPGVRP